MTKFGAMSKFEYVQCLNHGVHLAVLEVIYKLKSPMDEEIDEQLESSSDSEASSESESESKLEGNLTWSWFIIFIWYFVNFHITFIYIIFNFMREGDEKKEEESGVHESNEDDEQIDYILQASFSETVIKMRKIALLFKRSAKKDEILKKIVFKKIKKPLGLILDSKTRWSSLQKAVERFLRIVDSVEEALKHKAINRPNLWSKADTSTLKVILSLWNGSNIYFSSNLF